MPAFTCFGLPLPLGGMAAGALVEAAGGNGNCSRGQDWAEPAVTNKLLEPERAQARSRAIRPCFLPIFLGRLLQCGSSCSHRNVRGSSRPCTRERGPRSASVAASSTFSLRPWK